MKNIYKTLWDVRKHPLYDEIFLPLDDYIWIIRRDFFYLKEIELGGARIRYLMRNDEQLKQAHLLTLKIGREIENGTYWEYGDDIEKLKNYSLYCCLLTLKLVYRFLKSYEKYGFNNETLIELSHVASVITGTYAGILELKKELTPSNEKEEARIEARIEFARAGGRAKQSPYQKAETIDKVNKLLQEKKELFNMRGGKAKLIRIIADLIVNGDIPAPSTPTYETIRKWVNNFQKNELTS